MYGVSDVQGTSTSIVPKAVRVWGAMVKDSVLGTLLAAYFPPVVMVTTGLETFKARVGRIVNGNVGGQG